MGYWLAFSGNLISGRASLLPSNPLSIPPIFRHHTYFRVVFLCTPNIITTNHLSFIITTIVTITITTMPPKRGERSSRRTPPVSAGGTSRRRNGSESKSPEGAGRQTRTRSQQGANLQVPDPAPRDPSAEPSRPGVATRSTDTRHTAAGKLHSRCRTSRVVPSVYPGALCYSPNQVIRDHCNTLNTFSCPLQKFLATHFANKCICCHVYRERGDGPARVSSGVGVRRSDNPGRI